MTWSIFRPGGNDAHRAEGLRAVIDQIEQHAWFVVYRQEALHRCPPDRLSREAAVRWARSMARIAEQFVDPDECELAEIDL